MARQEEALARWLTDHPEYQLAERLVDAGISAGSGKHRTRGALARFIEGGRTGAVPPGSCLVVESMSRFSREAERQALEVLLRDVWGQRLGIAFAEGDGAVLTGELIDAEPHRLYGLLGALSQARAEYLERSRRSKGAAAQRRRLQDEGRRPAGRSPWWMARDATGRLERDAAGALTVDPHYGAALRRAAELAIDGLGVVLIAAQLTEEGFSPPPTSGARNQHRRGQPAGGGWTAGAVSRALRHPALVGVLQRSDRIIPGYYPRVLSDEEHARMRAAIERRDLMKGRLRGVGHKAHSLLQGVIRCAVCNGPITFTAPAARARAGHRGYVVCAASRRGVSRCCNRGYADYGALEDHALTRLQATAWDELLRAPDADQERQQLSQRVTDLQSQRDAIRGQLEGAEHRAEQAWLEGTDPERLATIERALGRLRQQLEQVEDTLSQAQQALQQALAEPTATEVAADLRARVAAFWLGLQSAGPAERRDFNRWLLSHPAGIEFRLHPLPPGQAKERRPVELLVGGRSQGTQPLAGLARGVARQRGLMAPERALQAGDLALLGGRGDAQLLEVAGNGQVAEDRTALWRSGVSLRGLARRLEAGLPAELGADNGERGRVLSHRERRRLALLVAARELGLLPAEG